MITFKEEYTKNLGYFSDKFLIDTLNVPSKTFFKKIFHLLDEGLISGPIKKIENKLYYSTADTYYIICNYKTKKDVVKIFEQEVLHA